MLPKVASMIPPQPSHLLSEVRFYMKRIKADEESLSIEKTLLKCKADGKSNEFPTENNAVDRN